MGETGPTVPTRPAVAWRPVGSAMAVVAVVLALTSGGYGYHRDELYFRMLPPAWGYVDQPGFTPLLVRALSGVVDETWSIRIPAVLAAAVTALLVALVARELGGGSFAQGLAAWGYGLGAFPLALGHLMFTAAVDLVAWVAAALFLLRAVLRREPRWWLAVGVVLGLAALNKLLIGLLVLSLAAGLVAVGPRRLPWRWVLAGAGVAALLALPTIVYQATHAWPQLTMSRGLSRDEGGERRILMVPMLLVLIGPPLVAVWVAGLVSLWRRRDTRFVTVGFVVLFLISLVTAGQVYYPLGLLAVVYAAGCVPVAAWGHRRLVLVSVAVNAIAAVVISLPVIPLSVLGRTPIPVINQGTQDQVGWPAYTAQIAGVWNGLSPADRASAALVTTNYGQAGAVSRYGVPYGLPAPLSGQNELWFRAVPPPTPVVLVVVGRGASGVASRHATCTVAARLDNGVGVVSEEQGQPVSVCRDARQPWSQVWGEFLHYD